MKKTKKSNAKKSNARRRGGKRPGAGRKPKPRAPTIPLRVAAGDMSAQDRAKLYLDLAIETLASVAGEGVSEAARVSAAKGIIQTANGELRAAQGTADQHQDDGWEDLLDRRPVGRAN